MPAVSNCRVNTRGCLKLLSAIAMCWLVCGGCGGPKIVPVSGTVFVDDEPAGPGMIIFQPVREGSEQLPSAMGQIDAAGKYALTTDRPGDGAVVGRHLVIVQGGSGTGDEVDSSVFKSKIPMLYADPASSGLTAEVPAEGGEVNLKLSSPK